MTKTAVEIIDEIAKHFNLTNNRSVKENTVNYCVYNGPNGKRCAYGYLFPDDAMHIFMDSEGKSVSIIFDHTKKHMKPEYAGKIKRFYEDLQGFHDDVENFTMEGLSERGLKMVKKLKLRYAND
jgi:hypothetical protein